MQKPPLISNDAGVNAADLDVLCDKLVLTEREIAYLKGILAMCNAQKRDLGIEEIIDDKVKSSAGVRKRLENFCNKGALLKTERKIVGKNKPIIVYKLKRLSVTDLNQQQLIPVKESRKSVSSVILKNPMVPHLGVAKTLSSPAIDDLICTVLFAAMEFNRQGKEKVIPVTIDWHSEKVSVVTRCVSGDDKVIARVTDLKYFIAMLTIADQLITHSLHEDTQPTNFFAIDVANINVYLKKDNTGGNIETALKALHRLSDTVFDIEELPQTILDRFGFENAFLRITPLANFGVYEDYKTDEQQRKTITVTFSLPEVIFQGILSDRINVYRINPNVLMETNEILFALHLMNRRLIGTRISMHYKSNLTKLKSLIAPDKKITEKVFRSRLFAGLSKHYQNLPASKKHKLKPIGLDDRGQDIISYYAPIDGYYIRIRGDDVTIHIDAEDHYVGIHSLHHALKKKTSISAKLPKGVSSFEDVDVDMVVQDLFLK
jgi:hypothetical protein